MAPREVPVLRRHLADALRGGRLDEAADVLARLKQADPLAVETRGLELEYLVRAGRIDEAAGAAASLVRLFPGSAHVLHWAARAAYRQRDYARAEALLRESRRAAPRWQTDWWLGRTLTQLSRFDEAEALLAPLMAQHAHVGLDLAWLYERRGEAERALKCVEAYRERFPDDALAERQRLRLQARTALPDELLAELDLLRDLGEDVPEAVLPEYVETLLRTGQGARARALVAEKRAALAPGTAVSIAWGAWRMQAWDVAFDLFLDHLAKNAGNHTYLAGLERAARACARLDDLAAAYRANAPAHPNLWGRLKKLGA